MFFHSISKSSHQYPSLHTIIVLLVILSIYVLLFSNNKQYQLSWPWADFSNQQLSLCCSLSLSFSSIKKELNRNLNIIITILKLTFKMCVWESDGRERGAKKVRNPCPELRPRKRREKRREKRITLCVEKWILTTCWFEYWCGDYKIISEIWILFSYVSNC